MEGNTKKVSEDNAGTEQKQANTFRYGRASDWMRRDAVYFLPMSFSYRAER